REAPRVALRLPVPGGGLARSPGRGDRRGPRRRLLLTVRPDPLLLPLPSDRRVPALAGAVLHGARPGHPRQRSALDLGSLGGARRALRDHPQDRRAGASRHLRAGLSAQLIEGRGGFAPDVAFAALDAKDALV